MIGLTDIDDKKIGKSSNSLIDKLAKSIKTIKSGKLHIEIQNKLAIDIVATSETKSNKISIDILEPELFDFLKGRTSDTFKNKVLPNGRENRAR